MEEHLAAFERSLGNATPKHANLTMTRVRRVVEGCRLRSIAGIEREAVEAFLRQLRADEDLGARTYNHYVQAFDAFCKWLVASKRLAANPLAGLERLNAEVDVRHKRRALAPEEVARLVESARSSGETIQGYTGEERARIYLFRYMTGLRRLEMASLTPSSFALDGDRPTVTVEAACSKHRHKDVLPLHPELVRMLRGWTEGRGPDEPLFPRIARRKTWLMVKKDLERVGIPYETREGVADFHAAGRHSHVTGLLRHGATLTEARELARHSDVRMTMKYIHIGLEDQARALAALPAPAGEWLHIGCSPRGAGCPEPSSDDTQGAPNEGAPQTLKPRQGGACSVGSPELSPPGKPGGLWRRREPLYETRPIHNPLTDTWFGRQQFFGLGPYSTQNGPLTAPNSRPRLEARGIQPVSRDSPC